jgi:hypothetical protein
MTIERKERGETAYIYAEFRNLAGELVNPTTSIKISIWDKDGTLKIDGVAMAGPDATGKYHYAYPIPGTATPDENKAWTYRVEATSGGYVDYKLGYFKVVEAK